MAIISYRSERDKGRDLATVRWLFWEHISPIIHTGTETTASSWKRQLHFFENNEGNSHEREGMIAQLCR